MKINKELLELIFESKIKEFMSIDAKTLYIKWDLDKGDAEKGITEHFYIYYSELISEIKDWALKNNYAITSGINKNVLKFQKNSEEYYNNYYIAEIYGQNIEISIVGLSELEAVQDVALKVLKG